MGTEHTHLALDLLVGDAGVVGDAAARDPAKLLEAARADRSRGDTEAFLRASVGTTLAQDAGFGRSWSPQVELLWARAFGGSPEWDAVPQVQVSLSKLQHVLVAAGVRVPLNERDTRHPRVLAYLLWDWFDGSFFDFWK